MLQLTGSGCTNCGFDQITKISSQASALLVNKQSWAALGFSNPPIDPWGNPYLIDENEGESGSCQYDYIYSTGPNGIADFTLATQGINPDMVYSFAPDNYYFMITHSVCP